MKSLLSTIGGGIAGGVLSYVLVRLFAGWYGPRYIQSDSDIGNAYVASLAFMLVCILVGSVMGFRMHRRRTKSRAQQ